jgi:hypothetical protein
VGMSTSQTRRGNVVGAPRADGAVALWAHLAYSSRPRNWVVSLGL